jgi:hypothetical protein
MVAWLGCLFGIVVVALSRRQDDFNTDKGTKTQADQMAVLLFTHIYTYLL